MLLLAVGPEDPQDQRILYKKSDDHLQIERTTAPISSRFYTIAHIFSKMSLAKVLSLTLLVALAQASPSRVVPRASKPSSYPVCVFSGSISFQSGMLYQTPNVQTTSRWLSRSIADSETCYSFEKLAIMSGSISTSTRAIKPTKPISRNFTR